MYSKQSIAKQESREEYQRFQRGGYIDVDDYQSDDMAIEAVVEKCSLFGQG